MNELKQIYAQLATYILEQIISVTPIDGNEATHKMINEILEARS
jgi:hypothetical protein